MKPLEGIKIIDFTQAHAGSAATMILSDFGAEVIKIERAGVGDLARYWVPFKNENSGYYSYLNRGKKSISIDASKDEGRKIIFELIKDADVVCENFKYGSMERMGLSYDEIKKVNPNIIYASLNGFGQTGPLKNVIGLDLQLQAMSGIMDITGFPDSPPVKAGVALGDHISGMYMALAINLALIHKKKTGEGQKIDIAILDALFSVLEDATIKYDISGEIPQRNGNKYPTITPYDTYKASDGYFSVSISSENQWIKFCEFLKINDNIYKKYNSNELRVKNQNLIKDIIERITINISKFEIEKQLSNLGISVSAVYSVSEVTKTDIIKEREMIVEVDDKALGKLKILGTPIKMEKTPCIFENGAPLLGEHTYMYMKQIGYSDEEIQHLIDKGIIENSKG